MLDHRVYLETALELAEQCLASQQTPVGALLVDRDNNIVAKSSSTAKSDENNRNGSIMHAELKLILDNQMLFSQGLPFTLYVTLEPCHMCMGAALVARVARIVWATDDYWGGAMKLYDISRDYLKLRLPEMIRTPYPDLQRRGADLWKQHLENTGHPEYMDRILKWQTKISV